MKPIKFKSSSKSASMPTKVSNETNGKKFHGKSAHKVTKSKTRKMNLMQQQPKQQQKSVKSSTIPKMKKKKVEKKKESEDDSDSDDDFEDEEIDSNDEDILPYISSIAVEDDDADSFVMTDVEDESDDEGDEFSDDDEVEEKTSKNFLEKSNSQEKKNEDVEMKSVKNELNDDDDEEEDSDSEDDNDEATAESHRKMLESLSKKDPEFYAYLQTHDKELLEFNDEDLLADDDDQDKEEMEEDETLQQEEKITSSKVENWRESLRSPSSKSTSTLTSIRSLVKAFRKVVQQTSADSDETHSMSLLDPKLFNTIINAALIDLLPALIHFLRLSTLTKGKEEKEKEDLDSEKLQSGQFYDPRRSRNWKKVLAVVKMYLTDVLKMVDSLSPEARVPFERHCLELVPYYNAFPHLVKRLVKRSISAWCSGDERNRVLAFLLLHRTLRAIAANDHLTRSERQNLVNHVLRRLYMAYVSVSKQTNESTVAQIGFMRASLVELYGLDHQLAYQHAFIFLRQLAINLRKSELVKQKDALKRVYNWQYVHSLTLWAHLISATYHKSTHFPPLLAPVVNITLQTLESFPPIKYLPYRLHLINCLVKLAVETNSTIPVLRFILETLDDLGKCKTAKPKVSKKKANNKEKEGKANGKEIKVKKGAKQINLEVMLKATAEQLQDAEFVERAVAKIYEMTLYYLKEKSTEMAFPEMVNLFYQEARKSVKLIGNPKSQTLMRQLLDKMDENAAFIYKTRSKRGLTVRKLDQMAIVERELRQDNEIPLLKFYTQWRTFKNSNEKKSNSDSNEAVGLAKKELAEGRKGSLNFDLVSKGLKNEGEKEDDEDEVMEDSDSNDDDEDDLSFDDDEEVELTEEQMAKLKKKIEKEEKELAKLMPQNDDDDDDDEKEEEEENSKESAKKDRKRKKKNRNRKNKKARKINPNLELEGAFELSSDED